MRELDAPLPDPFPARPPAIEPGPARVVVEAAPVERREASVWLHLRVPGSRLRGGTLGNPRTGRDLIVRSDALDPEALSQTAIMPALTDLAIFAPRAAFALGALAQAPHQQKLLLDTASSSHELASLATCRGLRSLALRLTPPWRDDEPVLLHGFTPADQPEADQHPRDVRRPRRLAAVAAALHHRLRALAT